MKKKLNVKILLLVLLILLILIGSLIVASPSFSNRIFEDISAFETLDAFSVKELSSDAKVSKLQPLEAYQKEICWEDSTYSVYAYVFEDVTQAQAYFAHVTGKESTQPGNFSSSGNYFFHTRYIAYYENCLYRVEGGSYPAVVQFVNWLNANFPLDLDSILKSEVAG